MKIYILIENNNFAEIDKNENSHINTFVNTIDKNSILQECAGNPGFLFNFI